MSNTLTNVIPQLLAQGLLALRENAIMPKLVNRGYEAMAGELGSTVTVPVAAAIAAQNVAPGATPPATADVAPGVVSIPVDQWKEAPFYLTDQELTQVMRGTIPLQASAAIKSLANAVDQFLLGFYKSFYGYQGTAGTTPFGSTPKITDAVQARMKLLQQLCPMDDMHIVLDPVAEANALALDNVIQGQVRGQNTTITRGQIGELLGFQWWSDQNVQTHTAGTITTGLVAKAATAQAIGDQTIVCTTAASTGACALLEGDVILFAGDTQTYVLTADATQASAASDVTLNIYPGLKIALAGSEAVTVKGNHVANIAFNRNALAFVSRPLDASMARELGSIIESAVDPVTGLTLRLEVKREHKRNRWSFDILYGGACLRPEFGCRIVG